MLIEEHARLMFSMRLYRNCSCPLLSLPRCTLTMPRLSRTKRKQKKVDEVELSTREDVSMLNVSRNTAWRRSGNDILIEGPSGVYISDRGEENEVLRPINPFNAPIVSMPEPIPVAEATFTNKDKQAQKWIDSVPFLMPVYLELMKMTESLTHIEDVQASKGICAGCEATGKGSKIVCLLFNRSSLSLSPWW